MPCLASEIGHLLSYAGRTLYNRASGSTYEQDNEPMPTAGLAALLLNCDSPTHFSSLVCGSWCVFLVGHDVSCLWVMM